MSDGDPMDKAKRVLTGASALALAIRVDVDGEHQEVRRVRVLGVPVFRRTDADGLPVVLGVVFPRWLRGRRKE